MSWTDECDVCGKHKVDCVCKTDNMSDGLWQMEKDTEMSSELHHRKKEWEKYEYDIKELVKDNFVFFNSFRQGVFYYTIFAGTAEQSKSVYTATSIRYQFPVPIEDIGTATLLAKDKAITFMRWIRKAIQDKTFIRI